MHVHERRQSERIRLSATAALNQDGRRIAAQLEDVSLGGALLQLEQEVHSGAGPSSVIIPFGRDPEEAILVLIRIVSVAQRFVRIRWEQPLPPEDWGKLRQLMERQFGALTVVQKPLPMLIWPPLLLNARYSHE